jgi:hypothetical protein
VLLLLYLRTYGTAQDGKSDGGYQPAEKGEDKTEGDVIRFNLLNVSIFRNEDRAQRGNPHDHDRPTNNQPFIEIGQ